MITIKNTLHNTTPIVLHCASKTDKVRRLIPQLLPSITRHKYQVSEDLTFLTWSNKEEKTLFEEQFDDFGIPYHVLGKERQNWVNRFKLPLTVEFLQTVKTKYVMGVDAFDVLFFDNPQKVLDFFINCGHKLIFNASAVNWPAVERHEKPIIDGSIFRFLNSGLWIGETEYTKKFFGDWKRDKEFVAEDFAKAEDEIRNQIFGSDQIFLKYLLPYYPEVGLDTKCEVFQIVNKDCDQWVDFERSW